MNIHKITGQTQDITDGFDSYETGPYDVGFGERITVETKLSAAPDTAAKYKVHGTVSGANFAPLKDGNGDDIELSLDAAVNIYCIAISGVNAIKLVGTSDGTGTSVLNEIYIGY